MTASSTLKIVGKSYLIAVYAMFIAASAVRNLDPAITLTKSAAK
ncbi:hypothetical protein UFOVP116_336 [uncultured Caudovirales phage]|uniref:Uncharacterized protein n=1 Tax=uncultured Caudovirales phage TaxID=2100421 RepID=A0A6J5LAB2_9CAUD|nr:hypothetical protein UFOVP116_336 [uncultured Caudovirales phage]